MYWFWHFPFIVSKSERVGGNRFVEGICAPLVWCKFVTILGRSMSYLRINKDRMISINKPNGYFKDQTRDKNRTYNE
jgi:hypothetical protein